VLERESEIESGGERERERMPREAQNLNGGEHGKATLDSGGTNGLGRVGPRGERCAFNQSINQRSSQSHARDFSGFGSQRGRGMSAQGL